MVRDYSDPDQRRRAGLEGVDRTQPRCPYADQCACFTDGYTDFQDCDTFHFMGAAGEWEDKFGGKEHDRSKEI